MKRFPVQGLLVIAEPVIGIIDINFRCTAAGKNIISRLHIIIINRGPVKIGYWSGRYRIGVIIVLKPECICWCWVYPLENDLAGI